MVRQSGLGDRQVYRAPNFTNIQMGTVTSVGDNYKKYGKIEVVFVDYSQPAPVWVVGNVDREPVEGDQVLVGYIDGRKDLPYLIGFVKNNSYTTNFQIISKDLIRLQLPVFDIGIEGGASDLDTQGNLLEDSNLPTRAYVELTPDHAVVSFPTSKSGNPITIKVSATGIEIDSTSQAVTVNAKDVTLNATEAVNISSSQTISLSGSGGVSITGSSKSDSW